MMLPAFLVLMIFMTLGSVFLYLRTANDIFGALAVCMAIACLIWGLVVAHWSILLLFLIALFYFRKPKAIARIAASIK